MTHLRVENRDNSIRALRNELELKYLALPIYNRPVALIDLPTHLNIGDSLIALGQFNLLGSKLDYRYIGGIPSEDILKQIDGEKGAIIFHGGGNFGTLWPSHQRLRERIATECPNATLIQLPQSTFFDSKDALEKSISILESHGDFHVLVRDQASYETLAQRNLASITLCPDSAFALEANPNKSPAHDILFVTRSDHESDHSSTLSSLRMNFAKSRASQVDWANWEELGNGSWRKYRFIDRLFPRLLRVFRAPAFSRLLWTGLFQSRLRLGVDLLSSGKVIVTDRLHVHILCRLIGKPHIFFDNNYGKISNLSDTWNTQSEISISSRTISDPVETIERLLRTP